MADPFRQYRKGDPVPRDAGTFNGFALGARMARDSGVGMSAGAQAPTAIQGELVRVRNESGSDLLRGAILGLDAPVFLPSDDLEAFQRGIVFRGIEPASHAGKFVILLEPAAQNEVVRAWIAGVAQVRVNVTDSAHTCAEAQSGETGNLVSVASGTAQILWREGGTGIQWALIRFGIPCSSGTTPDDPFETGDCFCPGGIGGLASAIVPAVLNFTATWYHASTSTVIGVTTGTLAFVNPLVIPDAATGTCPIGGSGVFGWYGPIQRYYSYIDNVLTGDYHPVLREACNTEDFCRADIIEECPEVPVYCCHGLWISCNYSSGVLGEEGHFGFFRTCDVPGEPSFLCESNGTGTFSVECDPLVFTIEQTYLEATYGDAVSIVITP